MRWCQRQMNGKTERRFAPETKMQMSETLSDTPILLAAVESNTLAGSSGVTVPSSDYSLSKMGFPAIVSFGWVSRSGDVCLPLFAGGRGIFC